MIDSFETDDLEVLGQGKFLRLVRVREGKWERADRINSSGVVAVIAVTADDELVLTEQYRPAVAMRVVDLPAGLAGDVVGDEDEALQTAAQRELEEETGYTATTLEWLAALPSSPGMTTEIVDLFRAAGVTRIGDGGGDDSEEIDVHVIPLDRIADWLQNCVNNGRLIDPKVYASLWWITS